MSKEKFIIELKKLWDEYCVWVDEHNKKYEISESVYVDGCYHRKTFDDFMQNFLTQILNNK